MGKLSKFLIAFVVLFFVRDSSVAFAHHNFEHQRPEIDFFVPLSATVGGPDFVFNVHGDKLTFAIIHFVNYPLMRDYQYIAFDGGVNNNNQIQVMVSLTPPFGIASGAYNVIAENNGLYSEFSEESELFTAYNAPPTASTLPVLSNACPVLSSGTGLAYFLWDYNDLESDNQKSLQIQVADSNDSNFECEIVGNPKYPCPVNESIDYPFGGQNQHQVLIKVDPEVNSLLYNKTYYWRVNVCSVDIDPNFVGPQGTCSGWVQGPNYTTIVHPWPYADFSFTLTSPAVVFTNDSICYDGDSTCNSYLWSFGDGIISNQKNPTHEYLSQCSDGLDNDTDGSIDFPNDLGCVSLSDTSESPVLTSYNVSLLVTDSAGQCQAIKPVSAPNKPYNSGNIKWIEKSSLNYDPCSSGYSHVGPDCIADPFIPAPP